MRRGGRKRRTGRMNITTLNSGRVLLRMYYGEGDAEEGRKEGRTGRMNITNSTVVGE
jgi:hypothetical protein